MRVILQSLVLVAVALFYVPGGHLTFECVHSHEGPHDHHHDHHHGHGHGHHHHHHDHEAPSDHPGDDSDDPNQHSHLIVFGGGIPTLITDDEDVCPRGSLDFGVPRVESDRCPDGPYFALIKPPQLA